MRGLKQHNPACVVRKEHGTVYAIKGDPDLHGSWPVTMPDGTVWGRAFSLEVKAPGQPPPTRLQTKRLSDWQKSGAIVGVPRSLLDALDYLEGRRVWVAPATVEQEEEGEEA